MNPKIDEYIRKSEKWKKEMELLREYLLDCYLVEVLKWRVPCYMYKKSNIIIIGNFKTSCTLSFFKGILLNDTEGILVAPGENSQSVRMLRFTNIDQIRTSESIIKEYIYEAIEIEKAGLKVELKKDNKHEFPEELLNKFKEDASFKEAFENLTPGRQRGYNLYFTGSKKSETRTSRIEKYKDRILSGKGINDCVCGFSKRMPNCDGSHKFIGQ